ncbi:DNA gyrase inhibitor YacG [Paludisphaera sp.]|uniref:DNA gyrase inhibitor YacG n=1 Tax=Paludisphaera sp. TaxID=2017432 RepID=UPI00301D65BA
MIRGRCPICSKAFEVDRVEDLPTFPFCSERCRLVDLGRWIDESYAIPGRPVGPAIDGTNGTSPSSGPGLDDDEDSY